MFSVAFLCFSFVAQRYISADVHAALKEQAARYKQEADSSLVFALEGKLKALESCFFSGHRFLFILFFSVYRREWGNEAAHVYFVWKYVCAKKKTVMRDPTFDPSKSIIFGYMLLKISS